jgi:glycosyltransferase involved in cell wall biosynthesis
MTQTPLVTLGVPVYNEEAYLARSLDDLLKQTYPNIEILIADNGSTDKTAEIAAAYAAKDPRIRHIRRPQNIGQNGNFNALPGEARGEYFCWVSGHDLLDPTFVADCAAQLAAHPEAVLAYPRTFYLDDSGNVTGEKSRPFDITRMSAQRRFREVMWRVDCNYVYGMYRRAAMVQTALFRTVPAADRVFLSEMAVRGRFVPADTRKYYRPNRGSVPQTELAKRRRLMGFIFPDRAIADAELAGNAFYAPTVRAFHDVVRGGGFPWFTRSALHGSVWMCGIVKFHLFPGADLLAAIVKAVLPKPLLRRVLALMQ